VALIFRGLAIASALAPWVVWCLTQGTIASDPEGQLTLPFVAGLVSFVLTAPLATWSYTYDGMRVVLTKQIKLSFTMFYIVVSLPVIAFQAYATTVSVMPAFLGIHQSIAMNALVSFLIYSVLYGVFMYLSTFGRAVLRLGLLAEAIGMLCIIVLRAA
jgi:hypothetical protein